MTDIDETSCKISISQIIVNSIAGEWCKRIRNFANIINENIDQLARIQDDDTRHDEIIKLLNFEETDMEKIVKKPARKTKDASDKADKPAKILAPPMPFWHVVDKKNGNVIASSVVEHKCQALKNPLYNQCTNDKQSGQDYCKQCLKKVNSEGVPKNGNIEMRKEQFKKSYYKFKTPDGKERQVYYAKYCENKKFAPEDVHNVIGCLNLSEFEYGKLMYKKETKAKKTTGEKPPPKKRANNDPKPEDVENEEQGDEQTSASDVDDDEQTIADDDQTIADDEQTIADEDVEFAPEIEIDISNYGLIKTGTANYAILKSEKTKVNQMSKLKKNSKAYENDEEYKLYEIKDLVSDTQFEIVSLDPVGFMKNLLINLYR